MTAPTIGYAGMTHLGLVSATVAAEKGFTVVCFDTETERLEPVRRGELPVVEPELPELLAKNQGRIQFTSSSQDLALCDVVYMALDVSTDEMGVSDLGPINHLLGRVDEGMGKGAVLVVLSQVPPGFTRRLSRPESHRFYQVETLIFGRAIERALNPERFIVGCADPRRPLPSPLATFLDSFACPILPMGFESAELAKISINMCLVASITGSSSLSAGASYRWWSRNFRSFWQRTRAAFSSPVHPKTSPFAMWSTWRWTSLPTRWVLAILGRSIICSAGWMRAWARARYWWS